MHLSLYVHFPFCVRKCSYCDFCSAPQSEIVMGRYCRAMITELRRSAERYPDAVIDTIFFGGGTPSLVPASLMRELTGEMRRLFAFSDNCEFTSEANPGTLREDWLSCMTESGMNRLSIGLQAAQDRLLNKIGRIHTAAEAADAVRMAHALGLNNINLDLMYGLPEQTEEDFLQSIRYAADLQAQHISAYSLILEPGTPLYDRVQNGLVFLPEEDAVCDMEEHGRALLRQLGYQRYEISNYARSGYPCRHNTVYWQDGFYLGIGIAAHSMLPPDAAQAERGIVRIRCGNTEDLDAYCKALEQGQPVPQAEYSEITAKDARFETMMLGLRMTAGVSEKHFESTHGLSLEEAWGSIPGQMIQKGYAHWIIQDDDRFFALTDYGMSLQNTVLVEWMNAIEKNG